MRRRHLAISLALALSAVTLPGMAGYSPPPVPQGPWTAYTPTVAAAAPGATPPTVSAAQGRYQITGKRVDFRAQVTISTNGTGGGTLDIGLPVQASSAMPTVVFGRNLTPTGVLLTGYVGPSASVTNVATATGTYPGGDAYQVLITGSYEAQ